MMNRPARAISGGFAGTALLSLLLLLLDVETRSAVHVFEAIARFVGMPNQLGIGFLLFFLAGSVAWPLVFVAVQDYLPRDDAAAKGVVLAVPLWIAFVVIGRGPMTGPLLLVFAGFTLLAHLAYGFTLGAVYVALGDGEGLS